MLQLGTCRPQLYPCGRCRDAIWGVGAAGADPVVLRLLRLGPQTERDVSIGREEGGYMCMLRSNPAPGRLGWQLRLEESHT